MESILLIFLKLPHKDNAFISNKESIKVILQMHFHAVDLEDAADAGLAYLVRVEQFELLGALVEVIAQGDAVAPALDLPALGPELDVNRVSGLEHPAKGADMDTLCHRSIGMRGQTLR